MMLLAEYSVWTDLDFWSGVIFVLLCLLLAKTALGPILKGLRGRERAIEEQFEHVDVAQREIRELRAEQDRRKQRLREEAVEIVAEAKRDAERLQGEMVRRAAEEAKRLEARAEREMNLAKKKALYELAQKATSLSIESARSALQTELSAQDHDRLIRGALTEIQGRPA